jgi:hypothetical protein
MCKFFKLDSGVLKEYVTLNATDLEGFNKSLIKHTCMVEDTSSYTEVWNNSTSDWETIFGEKEAPCE